jgi:hypothetical protein
MKTNGPANGSVVQAQDGQAAKVDGARSGQDIGQDAFVSAAPRVSAAPGAAGSRRGASGKTSEAGEEYRQSEDGQPASEFTQAVGRVRSLSQCAKEIVKGNEDAYPRLVSLRQQ